MCVPGVQAWATLGVKSKASRTAIAILLAVTAREGARMLLLLNTDALTLPPDCLTQIGELVSHDVVDCAARSVDVVANLIDDFVDRYPIDQILAALDCGSETSFGARTCPARAFHRSLSSPARAFESALTCPPRTLHSRQTSQRCAATGVAHERPDWSATRRSTSQKQRDSRTDSCADQRRRQQVVLLLTLLVQFRLWV
jgi:hypothetical protein